ncbi:MAG: hypothetical protein H6732_14500 [Alphaproteobacteria bacterium]|nr:hypothetical protein [Alphaproteobacteria bacterium]
MRSLWIPVLACIVACAEAEADLCASSEAGVQLGSGEDAFVPMDDGDDALLVHGPQGGYHLDVGLAATGLVQTDRVLATLTGTLDDVELARVVVPVTFRCDAPTGRWLAWGMRLVYGAQPEELDERDTVVRVALEGPDGILEDELALHIVDLLVPEVP